MNRFGIPAEGKGIRQLCGAVLIFEAIVIVLAIPVAIVLEHANHGLAGGIGGGLAVCAILIGGVVGRPRMAWALVAGTILQVLIIAAGVVVPAMYALGAIFAALWFTGIWLARRHAPSPAAPLPSDEASLPSDTASLPSDPDRSPRPVPTPGPATPTDNTPASLPAPRAPRPAPRPARPDPRALGVPPGYLLTYPVCHRPPKAAATETHSCPLGAHPYRPPNPARFRGRARYGGLFLDPFHT